MLPSAPAKAADLKVLVDTSTDMPMADVRDGQLVGGIHRSIGEAIARHLGRSATFELLPRKRIAMMLEQGKADLSCHFLPAWLAGEFDWTMPFMPNATLLVSDRRGPRPDDIASLADQPLGTVLGFVYPEVSAVLGGHFLRTDASSALGNLRKLAAGHLRHALVGQLFLNYQQRTGRFTVPIYPPIVVHRYEAQCAVSRRGQVSVDEVNSAVQALKRSRDLEAIYEQYR